MSQVETRGLTGETTTYGYDEAERLIGVAYPAETHLYQVDAVGNRTGEKRAAAGVVAALTVAAFAALSPGVASAAVERQHNAVDWVTAVVDVKASTTTVLTYDGNGNRRTEGTKQYAWDIRDTLTRVQEGSTVVGTYDYDAKLQRVKADTAQGHVEYVLDGKYVLREAGARSRRYHFGEGEALAVTGVGGSAGQDRWLLTDALGSVSTEVDATATSVTARQFDAWGNYRNSTAPTANETRLGYTGHQFDVETGLTYARARYYDSKLGVFLSRDSFEGSLNDAPSLHRFTYVHNRPLKYRDPSGRRIENDWPVNDPALAQARADCRGGDCQEIENASRLLDTAAMGTSIGMAGALALEGGAVAALWEGTAGPLVDAGLAGARALASGVGRRELLLRVGVSVAEPLRRFANNVASWVDENPMGSTGFQPVAGQVRREVAEQFDKQATRTTATTVADLTERPALQTSSAANAPQTLTEAVDAPGTTTFWHGTDDESAPRVAKGIDFSEGKPGQDFDPNGQASFYVTKDRAQAERWARERASERRTNPALVRYDVPNDELATLSEKSFSGTTQDWQDFVKQSRSGTGGPEHHPYDLVSGPYATNPRDAMNLMSAKPIRGRGNQTAVCTTGAACVFDASNPTIVPVKE